MIRYRTDTSECLVAGHSIPVESFGRIQLWGDLMQIRRVDAQDAGRYVCRVSNQLGEQRAETHLSVTSKLNARIQPRVQVRTKRIIRSTDGYFSLSKKKNASNFISTE